MMGRRHLAVCLGRGDVGYIDQVGRTYTATALDGRSLGVFADLKSAANAVSTAALSTQPVSAHAPQADNPRANANRGAGDVENSAPRRSHELNAASASLMSAQKVDC
jgi:hypothetical protein